MLNATPSTTPVASMPDAALHSADATELSNLLVDVSAR